MEHLNTETYISLASLVTLLGILKPAFTAHKDLEAKMIKLEADLKHLENTQHDRDKDFDKLSKKIDGVESKLSKIENSIVRIETLLQQKSYLTSQPTKS
jgi:peptidoglycan hydrolase CwlO-like protein